jgi:hypothetical protein
MNDIDQIFQERLSNASVSPPPYVWDGVEKELRKKRRRSIFWWSLGLGVLLGVASLTWFGFSGTMPTKKPTQEKLTANTPSTSLKVEMTPIEVTTAYNTKQKDSKEFQTVKHTISTKSGGVVSNIQAMTLPLELSPILTNAIAERDPKQSDSNTPTNSRANSTQHLNTEALDISPASIIPIGTPDAQYYAALKPLRSSMMPLKNKMAIVNTQKWQHKIIRKKKETDTKCYDFESHANAWLFDAYTGPIYAQKSLSEGSDPENKTYRDLRWNTESHKGIGFTAGLRASFLAKQHFSVGTGIDYQQFTETFSYEKPLYIQVLIDPNTGDTLDLDLVTQRFKQYSRLGFVNIPFSVGYEIRQGRRGIHLRGGGAINLLFWKNGTMMHQTTLQPDKFNNQDAFRVNAGLSLMGSAQFFLHIQPRTRLFAEPYYQRILKPVTKDSYPLQQNYNLIGLRLGLTKIF